jgi:hypothetical protein
MFLSAVMAYLAVIDGTVRAAFSQLASSAIGGYLALTTPQKRDKEIVPQEEE